MKIGFIGFGRMGSALAEGAVAAGSLRKNQIMAVDRGSAGARISKSGFRKAKTIAALVKDSDFVFLCVKPQGMNAVLGEISATVLPAEIAKKCFVSIAAGVVIDRLEKLIGSNVAVIRVMPNTPALLGAGMSGVTKGKRASSEQVARVSRILKSVGDVVVIPERLMDALTAVSGSGPAYAFYLAESMMEAAKSFGFDSKTARLLVHQTVFGAGLMLKKRTETAEELRRQVTSPGGTTEAALKEFMRKGLKQIIGSGLRKAAARSKELK